MARESMQPPSGSQRSAPGSSGARSSQRPLPELLPPLPIDVAPVETVAGGRRGGSRVARFVSAALWLVLAVVLLGIYTADRAFVSADSAQKELDARESALIAHNYLSMRGAALESFHALFSDGIGEERAPGSGAARALSPASRTTFTTLATTLRAQLRGFDRVWVADTSGHVRHELIIGHGYDAHPAAGGERWMIDGDLDTIPRFDAAALMRDGRAGRRLRVSPPDSTPSGARVVLMLEPIVMGDQLVGIVAGTLLTDSLIAQIERGPTGPHRELRIEAGNALVASRTAPRPWGGLFWARAMFDVSPDQQWSVIVGRPAGWRALRLSLWSVGLVALFALWGGLMRERREGRRAAERSRELEHLSAELIRANRAKSEFLANVSHELRTPLNAIVGFVELLADGVYGELPPRQASPVGRIAASAQHLRELVDQILDLAKMAAGRLEVHNEVVTLRPFTLEVATAVESLLTEHGLALSIQVGGSLPKVRTDPTHLRQILMNLIGNATKFTKQGGITIRATLVSPLPDEGGRAVAHVPGVSDALVGALRERAPDASRIWIALQVSDTGVGIAPTDLERIFEEFEQVGAGPRGDSARRGTGLGLAISRRLARLLGGDVTVESEPGRGSTFTVWLTVQDVDVVTASGGVKSGEAATANAATASLATSSS